MRYGSRMQEEARRRLAFVVKVWFEPREAGEGQWRGVVQSLDDGRRRYFTDLSDAVAFLRTAMASDDRVP